MHPNQMRETALDEFAKQILDQRILDAIDQVEFVRKETDTDEKSVDEISENALSAAVNNAVNKVEINPGKFQFLLKHGQMQMGLLLDGTALLLMVCILFGLLFGIEPLVQLLKIVLGR